MTPKKRLGEMLMDAGIIDETQLKAALGHQRQWGVRLGQALVDLKLATEADIVGALAVKYGFGVAEINALEPYALEQALKLLPRDFAVRNNVFPMAADTASITVAMSDPTNLAVVDEIRFRTGRKVRVCIGGDREVAGALQHHYPSETAVEAIALDLDADDGAETEAVFDPFGGGSKDALEAFFSSEPDASAGAAPQPAATEPPPAASTKAPVAAKTAAAQPAGRAGVPAAAASRPPAEPAAPIATPAPSAARAPAAAPPAPAQRPAGALPRAKRLELELEELTPGVGRPVAPPAQQETTGTAEFTLTDEITGSGLLIPDEEAAAAPAGRALTERELEVLEALERLAGGHHAQPEILKPAQAMAVLALLLVRKGVVSEQELLAALSKR